VRTWLKWGARGCEILAAATVLLVLMQLHTAFVENALTMMGARTDVPLIVSIKDNCGIKPVAAAWRAPANPIRGTIAVCNDEVQAVTTTPPNEPLILMVNDRPIAAPPTPEPLISFPFVRLRPGINRLFVVDANETVEFPLVSLYRTLDLDGIDVGRSYLSTWWAEIPRVVSSFQTRLLLNATSESEQRREGPYPSPDGSKWLLVQGRPGDQVRQRPDEKFYGDDIGQDGFAIVHLPSDAPVQPEGRDLGWRRELTLTKNNNQGIDASLMACLAPDHPLIAWSRENQIEAPELIMRLTGMALSEPMKLADGLAQDRHPVAPPEQQGESSCVKAQYSVSNASLLQLGSPFNSFLRLKGDQLILQGFSGSAPAQGRPPDERGDDRIIWRGNIDAKQPPPRLELIPLVSQAARSPVRALNQPQVASTQQQGLWVRSGSLFDVLPNTLQQLLWGFAAAAPVALIYWALGLHRPDSPRRRRIDQARAGLLALLAFMTALALHPVLRELFRSVVDFAGLSPFLLDDARINPLFSISDAPIAFVVVLVILRLLPRYRPIPMSQGRWWVRALAALASLLIVAVAAIVCLIEHWIATDIEGLAPPEVIGTLILVWCLFGLLVFWIPVFWLARSAIRSGRLASTALFAAVLAFFVPLVSPAAEFVRILIAAGGKSRIESELGFLLSSIFVAVTSVAGVVIMVSLTLCSFREIAASMLEPAFRRRLRAWTGTLVLIIAAVLIVEPATAALSNADNANLRVLQLMTVFAAYAALIAVIAPLSAMLYLDKSRRSSDFETRFRLDDSVVRLLTVAFAGYLTYWLREPVGVLILIGIGWVTFKYGVIDPYRAVSREPAPDLAKRILIYRAEMRLISGRRKAVEQDFTDGKIDEQGLSDRRSALITHADRAQADLGVQIGEAKRRLLGFGPGSSPFANGLLGALAGLVVGALFQIILAINFKPVAAGQAPNWLAMLQNVIVDPKYQPVSVSDVSPVLALVTEVLNAFTIWVLVGFLFGYSFDRIRGSDGFSKAIVFGGGIAITFLVSQAIIARGSGVQPDRLAAFLPIFIFLICLGSLVFDGKSVEKRGASLGQLPDIYGLTTSIGYASFAGLIAAIQPLLQFTKWIFGR
jgi:hypothetical protein